MARNARLLAGLATALAVCLVAAGSGSARPVVELPMIAHWDGQAWTQVPGPKLQGSLTGIAAASASQVWAVGSARIPHTFTYVPLAERWDGSAWRRLAVLMPQRHGHGELVDVAAVSATDVWAVGYWGGKTVNSAPLIEHWNGTAWKVVPTPRLGAPAALGAVSALSATDAWAVGWYGPSAKHVRTLVLHWNGTRWARVPSPSPAAAGTKPQAVLTDVVAVSAGDAWAVGHYVVKAAGGRRHSDRTLVLHWDGKSWTGVPSPNLTPLAHGNYLLGLASAGPNDVWAVGDHGTGHGQVPLVEHWDGHSWRVVPAPAGATPSFDQELRRAAAVSPGDVWAAGGYSNSNLFEHWDGSSWSRMSVSSQPPLSSLYGIAAVSADDVWAVGQYLKP